MTSLKLKIINNSDINFINNKVKNYNYAFHFLYKKLEESGDRELIDYIMKRFSLNDIEYRSLLSSVKSFYNRNEKDKNRKLKRISNIEIKILELNDKPKTKRNIRDLFKLNNKLVYLIKSVNNNIVFGGRKELQEISRLYNKINKINNTDNNLDLNNTDLNSSNQTDSLKKDLNNKLKNYKEKRKQPLFIIGESNQKGNRFFDFTEILDNKIIYKPTKNFKIILDIADYKNYKKVYKQLIEKSNNNDISISITLNNNYINLCYDVEKLNNYNINEKERLLEVKEVKKQNYSKIQETELIKEIYIKYYKEADNRKLENKLPNRYIGIDLNPNYIGYSVIDKTNKGITVIHTGSYSLKELNIKLKLSSDNIIQKKLNGKRKNETYCIIKNLVNLASHYKVSYICIEDLNFGIDDIKSKSKEANRLINNLWYRTIITNSLYKRCNEVGIQIVKVNPVYSSFIGNIMYEYVDPINSSIEIGRRGIYKYEKNRFYPLITNTIIDTVEALNSEDVLNIKGSKVTWVELYHSSKFRWRKTLKESRFGYDKLRLFAYGSGIRVIKNYERFHYS